MASLALAALTACGSSDDSGAAGDDGGEDSSIASEGSDGKSPGPDGNASDGPGAGDGTVSDTGGAESGGKDGGGGDSGVHDSGAGDTGIGDTGVAETGAADTGAADSGGAGDAGTLGPSVLQFHNHVNRDGLFVDPAITTASAATFHRDTTFDGAVVGNVYASPLYVANGPGGKGAFYVVTESNDVYALDETTGKLAWPAVKNVGTPCKSTGAGCGNISPIGITGTPAIDPTTRTIVLDAAIANASGSIATHTIFGLSIDDGSQRWSVDVSTLKDGTGLPFSPKPQNQRGAVLIVGGVAYVVYGGHWGDCGTYHGWVVGVPLSGTGAKAWATQVSGAGIWGPGGAASDGQSIYVTTGNGFDGAQTTWAESEGVFRLDPGPSFTQASADYFAPFDWLSLDQGDTDLSGSGPLVIDAPSMTPSTLVMAQGKDGKLYLLDRTNLGGVATTDVGMTVQSGEISNAGAWANVGNTTYVVIRPNGTSGGVGCPGGTSGDLVAVKLDPAAPKKMSMAWCADSMGVGSPSITTSDGTSDALVWAFGADPGGSAQLHAWDLATGAVVFAGGAATDKALNVRRFTTPIAVNGRILVAGDNKLYAFTH
jgi:hypothetical protein